MKVALHTVINASKKEPLAELANRVRQAFLDAALGEPAIRFMLTDKPAGHSISVIDRVLKRHSQMEQFLTDRKLFGSSSVRALSNVATGDPAEYPMLQAILLGVPRSYPFPAVSLHFYAPEFGERLIGLPASGHSLPGVIITDNWWVNGRQRMLSAYTVVDASETDKKLPSNPQTVNAVINACGKPKKTAQVPIPAPGGGLVTSIPRENAEAVKAIADDYRARINELVESAQLPHHLPPAADARNPGVLAGPRKPALDAAFSPMGYSCKGGTGEFHLTRRTSGNLTVDLHLDVGTWSHSVTAIFMIHGAGFRAPVVIPVTPGVFGQYPIGDAAQWQKIVENLAAMVRVLDRTFVPAIEQAAGPSPAWYQPNI